MSFITWIKNFFNWGQKGPKYNLIIVRSKAKPTYETKGDHIEIRCDQKNILNCYFVIIANEDGFRELPFATNIPNIDGKKGDKYWYVVTTSKKEEKFFKQGYVYCKKGNNNKKVWFWVNDPGFVVKTLNAEPKVAVNASDSGLTADAGEKVTDKPATHETSASDTPPTLTAKPEHEENVGNVNEVTAEVTAEENVGNVNEVTAEVTAEENVGNVNEVTAEVTAEENVGNVKTEVTAEVTAEENVGKVKAEVTAEVTAEENVGNVKTQVTAEVTAEENVGNVKAEVTAEVTAEENEGESTAAETKEEVNPEEKIEDTASNAEETAASAREMENLRNQLNEIKGQNADLLKEILNILNMKGKEQLAPKEILKKLREHIAELQKKALAANDEAINVAAAKDELQKQFNTLEAEKNKADQECQRLKNARNQAVTDAETAKNEKEALAQRVSELEATEAGQLKAELDAANESLAAVTAERDAAKEDSEAKAGVINAKEEEIRALNTAKTDLTNSLNVKTSEAESLTEKLRVAETTIKKHEGTIEGLRQKNAELESGLKSTKATLAETKNQLRAANRQITDLISKVEAQELENNRLNSNIETLVSEKGELANIIAKDIATLLESYAAAAQSLKNAVTGDFIFECNPDKDSATVESMCDKIRHGVASVVEEIEGLKSKALSSATQAEEAFCKIIEGNIEGKTFSDIVRWWAYSRLPFMANKDREEGRGVDLTSINAAYAALSRLIAMAGYNYQIPALFVENLEDGEYDDRTGKDQFNLEYHFSNARLHAENIDRADRDFTILDIVTLGYCLDGKLVKPTAIIR